MGCFYGKFRSERNNISIFPVFFILHIVSNNIAMGQWELNFWNILFIFLQISSFCTQSDYLVVKSLLIRCSSSFLWEMSRDRLGTWWLVLANFWDETLWLIGWWGYTWWFSTKKMFIFWESNHGINVIYMWLQNLPWSTFVVL